MSDAKRCECCGQTVMLTLKQRETLRFIERFIEARGYAPSSNEGAKRFGINRTTYCQRVSGLIDKGVLIQETPRYAGLRVREFYRGGNSPKSSDGSGGEQ